MDASDEIVDAGLEERLQSHSRAFESLLALTPAREYYGNQVVDGQDPSEQWNRKKQTKEEKRAAKKAKLDPANQKSALDIMKERELKRKRELGIDADGEAQVDTNDASEHPENVSKRQKVEVEDPEAGEARRRAKAEKRKEKRQAKQEKVAKKKAKVEARKASKADQDLDDLRTKDDVDSNNNEKGQPSEDLDAFDASGLAEPGEGELQIENTADVDEAFSAPSSPDVESPSFDVATNHSAASSSSSIVPPSNLGQSVKASRPRLQTTMPSGIPPQTSESIAQPVSGTSSPKIQLPDIDQAELQERLRLKIEALRARRKADGADGKPAKSRQELLDQRRKKGELRKAAKKEQRRKQREEEQRQQEAQLRGSGSPLSGDIFGARSPQAQENNFSFSRLAFDDGTAATADLTGLTEARKQKGRSDPKTALEAAQKKQARIAGLDDEKRADIAEKDLWLNAKKRAHGERVRDDTNLLKKALKRQDKQKSKSEKQWQEREEAVVKGKEMKQKRREANLLKRREEKGQKGKKKKVGSAKGGKKSRPGFEGRFKA